MYANTRSRTFGLSIDDVRRAHPEASIPDGIAFGDFVPYAPSAIPQFNPMTQHPEETFPEPVNGELTQAWAVRSLDAAEAEANLAKARAEKWGAIKVERDRRKYLGVKVGDHWFHGDDPSRIQQLALVMMGANMPPGIPWKTLALSDESTFVTMTPTLASDIFTATAAQDVAVFSAAEVHRAGMLAAERPDLYSFSAGWPPCIEDDAQ